MKDSKSPRSMISNLYSNIAFSKLGPNQRSIEGSVLNEDNQIAQNDKQMASSNNSARSSSRYVQNQRSRVTFQESNTTVKDVAYDTIPAMKHGLFTKHRSRSHKDKGQSITDFQLHFGMKQFPNQRHVHVDIENAGDL